MNNKNSKKERDKMTINTRKHMPSTRQVGGESVMFEQNTKSILRAISRSCALLFIVMALCGLTSAQSTDPANPTPITSNKVQGFASKAGATYYYRFKAKPGSVTVTLKGWTNNYATQFEADLLSSDGTDLGDIYVSASDTPSSKSKDFSFDSDQPVTIVVKLLKDENVSSKNYIITLAGAVDLGGQGGGNNPSPDLPDLKVTDVKIGGIGGDTATVFVSNVCNGNVLTKTIRIRIIIYKGADKNSGEAHRMENDFLPALAANTSSTQPFSLGPPSGIKSFNGRYIRVEVDPDNQIKETIETNNWWETGAAPFPDGSDHCNPKSP
jgi:hypothetical protein